MFQLKPGITPLSGRFISPKLINEPLKVKRYGFLEPVIYKRIRNPNVILIPLLAYDRFRNRLGYGKGYYDSTISKLR